MARAHQRAPEPAWAVVVPVKRLGEAKSRLAGWAGAHTQQLALAMAADTVTAALSCPRVQTLVVVTDDPVAAPTLADAGAGVVPDAPDSGLNPALRYGAARAAAAQPGLGIAALSADLPALRPAELERALNAASEHPATFVPDSAGVGTTLYAATPRAPFAPEFGAGSRERHVASGAHELTLSGIDTLRADVDTARDLDRARGLGTGPRTAAVAGGLGLR